jgi:hypothetical protein
MQAMSCRPWAASTWINQPPEVTDRLVTWSQAHLVVMTKRCHTRYGAAQGRFGETKMSYANCCGPIGYGRRYYSRQEKAEWLEAYAKSLDQELTAVRERIKDLQSE